MIDFDNVEIRLINLIRNLVGSELSTVKIDSIGTTAPAVFMSRSTATTPNEAYITLEQLTVSDADGYLDDRRMNELEEECYSTQKRLVYRISGYAPRALPILQSLNSKLRFSTSQDYMITNANTSILRWNPPTIVFRIMSDETNQNAFMDIFLGAWDQEVDALDNSSIERVQGEGTINDVEGNPQHTIIIDVEE